MSQQKATTTAEAKEMPLAEDVCAIRQLNFQREVQRVYSELVQRGEIPPGMKFTGSGILALQTAAEGHLVRVLQVARARASIDGRYTVKPSDMCDGPRLSK